jgi:hypothetical protein
VQSDVLPVLQTLADTHARVGVHRRARPSGIMGFVEDTSRTFGAIPWRGAARPSPAPDRQPPPAVDPS